MGRCCNWSMGILLIIKIHLACYKLYLKTAPYTKRIVQARCVIFTTQVPLIHILLKKVSWGFFVVVFTTQRTSKACDLGSSTPNPPASRNSAEFSNRAKVRGAVVTEDQPALFPGPDLAARAELEVSKWKATVNSTLCFCLISKQLRASAGKRSRKQLKRGSCLPPLSTGQQTWFMPQQEAHAGLSS